MFVYGRFAKHRCNLELVELEPLTRDDQQVLKTMVRDHLDHTQSAVATDLLDNWDAAVGKFVKVMPRDYKLALERLKKENEGKTDGKTNRI